MPCRNYTPRAHRDIPHSVDYPLPLLFLLLLSYTSIFLSWRQTATSLSFEGVRERWRKPVTETSRSWYDVGLSTVAVRPMHILSLDKSHRSLTHFSSSSVLLANRSCRAGEGRQTTHSHARQPDFPGSAGAWLGPGHQACYRTKNDAI